MNDKSIRIISIFDKTLWNLIIEREPLNLIFFYFAIQIFLYYVGLNSIVCKITHMVQQSNNFVQVANVSKHLQEFYFTQRIAFLP